MRNLTLLALCLLPLLVQTQAQAQTQIYKTTDENGNVVYTDTPPASSENNAEEITLEPINSAPPPPQINYPSSSKPIETVQQQYKLAIVTPADETTIPNGPGNFSVSASVSPSLRGDDKLQLQIDGNAHGEPQKSSSWALTNISRGAHQISVNTVNGEGNTLSSSESITVYVYRPSLNIRPGN